MFVRIMLSALGCAAGCADQTPFLIDEGLGPTVRTLLALGIGAIGYVFLQCAFHTVLPCVDACGIKFETTYKFQHLINGHTIT